MRSYCYVYNIKHFCFFEFSTERNIIFYIKKTKYLLACVKYKIMHKYAITVKYTVVC